MNWQVSGVDLRKKKIIIDWQVSGVDLFEQILIDWQVSGFAL
jgi:hypothetical protein